LWYCISFLILLIVLFYVGFLLCIMLYSYSHFLCPSCRNNSVSAYLPLHVRGKVLFLQQVSSCLSRSC
jgi:hypothetical protein